MGLPPRQDPSGIRLVWRVMDEARILPSLLEGQALEQVRRPDYLIVKLSVNVPVAGTNAAVSSVMVTANFRKPKEGFGLLGPIQRAK